MSTRRHRRRRPLHIRCPETPAEWASLMISVLTSNASEIIAQLEVLINRSHDHRLRNELLHALHDVMDLRNYAEGCIERLVVIAELQNGSGG